MLLEEIVKIGWDLCRTVIEARDTLEAELKHSEHSFAGMLEGILDQKLDYMMHVLQESNLSRSASMSSPFSPSSQSSILNAQQVNLLHRTFAPAIVHIASLCNTLMCRRS